MDRNSEEYQQMRDKALSQLRSGESLTGKDGAFGPLLKEARCPLTLTLQSVLTVISVMVVEANESKLWPAK